LLSVCILDQRQDAAGLLDAFAQYDAYILGVDTYTLIFHNNSFFKVIPLRRDRVALPSPPQVKSRYEAKVHSTGQSRKEQICPFRSFMTISEQMYG
jgi:hypothetical protein